MGQVIEFTEVTEDGDEIVHELPAKFEVCSRCRGYGTHLNPSIGNHAYTVEEFNESFDDEEAEEYFKRGGIYDVPCEECAGARVVSVVDADFCDKRLYDLYVEEKRNVERENYEDAYIRRMESGGYDY